MKPTIIETDRLIFREMTQTDLPALKAILQDERVMYAYEGSFNDEETMSWLNRQLDRYQKYGFGLWALILKETGKMIGQCGITMQPYKDKEIAEIGYLLAHKYWHNGYATEAAEGCREYGFNTLHLTELYSIIRDTNLASQNVAIRNGMRPFDTEVRHYRGIHMPHLIFRVTKD